MLFHKNQLTFVWFPQNMQGWYHFRFLSGRLGLENIWIKTAPKLWYNYRTSAWLSAWPVEVSTWLQPVQDIPICLSERQLSIETYHHSYCSIDWWLIIDLWTQWLHKLLEFPLHPVVDNSTGSAFWLGRSVMTESCFREPAMLDTTERTVTDQFE